MSKRDDNRSERGTVSHEIETQKGELRQGTTRRDFLRMAGLGGAALIGGPLLAACADDGGAATTTAAGNAATTTSAAATSTTAVAPASGRAIKIGYVSPQTGPFAQFGESDEFVLELVRAQWADGIDVGGTLHPVEILSRDSQSLPVEAGAAAEDLILNESVDLMVAAFTPETTNPVADQCELNGVPCLTTVTPWQAYVIPRGGDPADPATAWMWTYHYFWGLESLIPQFIAMWDLLDTNKVVGGLFPNDGDGTVWSEVFPPALEEAGYSIVVPGLYENLSQDFTAQINAYKEAGADIITGVPLPPDFVTFWTQAAQQDLTPVAASIGKAILFPASVDALDGDSGDGLTSEVWWSPGHPFTSSLTGQTSAEVAAEYEAATGRQWTQPLGFAESLFEIANDLLPRTEDIDDPESVLSALVATDLATLVGPVTWSSGDPAQNPFPNVSTTPLVGGQWVLSDGGEFKYDLAIVENTQTPDVPTTAEMKPIGA